MAELGVVLRSPRASARGVGRQRGRPKGGHALAIIPNTTHYKVFASPVLAAAALAFLDAPDA